MDKETPEDVLKKEYADYYRIRHTPRVLVKEPGRNDICPYCNSGKKFKNCECYKTHHKQYKLKDD